MSDNRIIKKRIINRKRPLNTRYTANVYPQNAEGSESIEVSEKVNSEEHKDSDSIIELSEEEYNRYKMAQKEQNNINDKKKEQDNKSGVNQQKVFSNFKYLNEKNQKKNPTYTELKEGINEYLRYHNNVDILIEHNEKIIVDLLKSFSSEKRTLSKKIKQEIEELREEKKNIKKSHILSGIAWEKYPYIKDKEELEEALQRLNEHKKKIINNYNKLITKMAKVIEKLNKALSSLTLKKIIIKKENNIQDINENFINTNKERRLIIKNEDNNNIRSETSDNENRFKQDQSFERKNRKTIEQKKIISHTNTQHNASKKNNKISKDQDTKQSKKKNFCNCWQIDDTFDKENELITEREIIEDLMKKNVKNIEKSSSENSLKSFIFRRCFKG